MEDGFQDCELKLFYAIITDLSAQFQSYPSGDRTVPGDVD
jgi:hypothetical protein